MKHEDLSTSEPPQSRADFGLKTTMERSPKTEFWVQWFCPYTPLECNPFTYTVGRAAAVAGFEGIHKSKAEQLPNGQFFPNEKAPLKIVKVHKKPVCAYLELI